MKEAKLRGEAHADLRRSPIPDTTYQVDALFGWEDRAGTEVFIEATHALEYITMKIESGFGQGLAEKPRADRGLFMMPIENGPPTVFINGDAGDQVGVAGEDHAT
jgi:hypothetical protein